MKVRMCAVIATLAMSGVAFYSEKSPYRLERIAHLSCKQAWIEADKSVEKAFGMIETMTVYLLKKRHLAFPNSQEAGQQFGQRIDQYCRADPDQLMLNAVDASLRSLIQ